MRLVVLVPVVLLGTSSRADEPARQRGVGSQPAGRHGGRAETVPPDLQKGKPCANGSISEGEAVPGRAPDCACAGATPKVVTEIHDQRFEIDGRGSRCGWRSCRA
jgi:hypothetical protein